MENLINKKFNFLTPIELVIGPRGYKVWKCLCDCGNTTLVETSHLKSGKKKSCGCWAKKVRKENAKKLGENNKKDIIGQRFGKLIVIKDTKKRKNQKILWLCKCDCGREIEVTSSDLKTNHTSSCGSCNHKSLGEYKISQLLLNNNISFETQKTFETCRFPNTNALAKFDFYVNNQYLIEYDGIQHFEYRNDNNGWNTQETFLTTQKRDNFKNQWCKDNNIPLIRIPYWKLNTLQITDLIINNI